MNPETLNQSSLVAPNNWLETSRISQRIPEGKWRIWVVLAGRGFGKTRTGAETIRQWVISGQKKTIALVGTCLEDIRNVMIEGPSGLLSISDPADGINYCVSKNIITWNNGAKAYLISAYNPQKIRGLQFDAVWIDEFVKMRNPRNLWIQVTFSLRLGNNPQAIITTTPALDSTLSKILSYDSCVKTGGSTYENSQNLSPEFLLFIKSEYEGTTIEQQEILGNMVSDDIFWTDQDIKYETPESCEHKTRTTPGTADDNCYCNFDYLTIGVDPSVNGYHSDTGIILAGLKNKKIYVLEDWSLGGGVEDWIGVLKKCCSDFKVLNVAIETNQGGNMLEYIIQNNIPQINIHKYFAKNGKDSRARVLSALYRRKEIFHSKTLELLEKQMRNYHKVDKKDRVDALIWAVYHILRNYETKKRLQDKKPNSISYQVVERIQ